MSAKRIVFVSRLDSDCSLGAYILCELAPRLIKIYENVEIYIVGGGEEYIKIRKKSEKINRRYNRKLIFAVGYSSDPSEYFTEKTLFIGVSRSAIEAMARSLPVILLGNEGYLGLLDKNKLQIALKSNLTCRNSKAKPSASLLFDEICRFYRMTEDEHKKLSDFSFSVAKRYFSAEESAAQTADFYNEIIKIRPKRNSNSPKCKKIALCGYYGRENFGDEAILSEILQKIEECSRPSPEISLIKSNEPHKIIPSLFGADLFIFGGGSLLQNSTSNKSLFFYLAVIFLANSMCKEKIMLANGIGPIEEGIVDKNLIIKMLQSALKSFDFISVRDENSQSLIKELLPNRKIHLIYDPATIYFLKAESKNNRRLNNSSENEIKGDKKVDNIVYIPNTRAFLYNNINLDFARNSLNHLEGRLGCGIIIAVLNREEENAARRIARGINNCKIITIKSRNQLISILKQAKICITQRYHGALYSLYCEAPTLVLSSDPKAQALCNELDAYPSACENVLGKREDLLCFCEQARAFAKQNKESVSAKILRRAKKTNQKLNKLFGALLK